MMTAFQLMAIIHRAAPVPQRKPSSTPAPLRHPTRIGVRIQHMNRRIPRLRLIRRHRLKHRPQIRRTHADSARDQCKENSHNGPIVNGITHTGEPEYLTPGRLRLFLKPRSLREPLP